MGFGLIAAGLVFLFNPNINVIDVLPDFIGFLLIYAGLGRISVLNADLRQARRMFLYMAAVDAAKLFSFAFTSVADKTRYLLFSFVFGTALCIMFIYALTALFDGIDDIGIRYSSEIILRSGKNGRDRSRGVKRSIAIFYFFRTIMSVIPELTELQLFDSTGITGTGHINYSSFKGLFYIIAIMAVLIASVPYLIRTLGFFVGLSRERDFMSRLGAAMQDFSLKHPRYDRGRVLSRSLYVAAFAVLLTVNPAPNGFTLIPLIVSCVLLASAVLCMRGGKANILRVGIPLVVCSVVSVIYMTFRGQYFSEYREIEAAVHFENASRLYDTASILALIQYLLTAAALIFYFYAVFRAYREYVSDGEDSCNICILPQLRCGTVMSLCSVLLGAFMPRICLIMTRLSSKSEAEFDIFASAYSWISIIQTGLTVAAFVLLIKAASKIASDAREEL